MGWLSLSELAGKPVIRWVIQVIRDRVRKSIEKEIEISLGEHSISKDGWHIVSLGINVLSKTAAKLSLNGMHYVIFHDGTPIHSGYWSLGSNLTSEGTEVQVVTIEPKKNINVKIPVNPCLVVTKIYSLTYERWQVAGTLEIDCAFGQIHKPFRTPVTSIATETEWKSYIDSLRSLNDGTPQFSKDNI